MVLDSRERAAYSQDAKTNACRLTYRNTTRKQRGKWQKLRARTGTPTKQKKLGRVGGCWLATKIGGQQKQRRKGGIPEEGPIPKHRDTPTICRFSSIVDVARGFFPWYARVNPTATARILIVICITVILIGRRSGSRCPAATNEPLWVNSGCSGTWASFD